MINIDIDNIDNKTLFYYIVIIILILFIISKIDVKLNIILGFFISIIIIYYLYFKNEKSIIQHTQEINNKIYNINPKSQNITKNEDIVNYIFSIQDLYIYNPQAYNEMIINIDHFIDAYDEVILNSSVSGQRYNTMTDLKRNSLNALASIINNMPPAINNSLTDKLNKATTSLLQLLNSYLDKVEHIHNKYIYYNGYTHNTNIIHKFYLPKNTFDTDVDAKYKNIHSYAFY